MSDFQILYRTTVFEPDDTTILSPRAGAGHSQDFIVSTGTWAGASQEYMGYPSGRRGRLSLLKGITDTGGLTFTVLDAKIAAGGDNTQRWVAAFCGDPENISQLVGLKIKIEERVVKDGTTTTEDFYTGRIESIRVGPTKNQITFQVRDMAEDLKYTIFTGTMEDSNLNVLINPTPAMNSAEAAFVAHGSRPAFAPIGLVDRNDHEGGTEGYGGFRTTRWMPGVYKSSDKAIHLDLEATHVSLRSLNESWPVGKNVDHSRLSTDLYNRNSAMRVRVRDSAGVFGDFLWGNRSQDEPTSGLAAFIRFSGQRVVISKVPLDNLHSTDKNSQVRDTFLSDDEVVHCYVYSAGDPSPGAPIYIDEVHPVDLFAEILDGKWGPLNIDGTVRRSFPRNSASFTTLAADARIPPGRWVIEKPAKLNEWVEKNICKAYQIGYRLNGSGEVVVFSTRRPEAATISGVPTIGIADLIASKESGWTQSRQGAITQITYKTTSETGPEISTETGMDTIFERLAAFAASLAGKDLLPVAEKKHQLTYLLAEADALKTKGLRKHVVDLTGIKTDFHARKHLFGITLIPEALARSWAEIHKSTIEALFNFGPIFYKVTVRRTTNTDDCFPGDWRKLQIPEQMDPANAKRGGLRVGMCLERFESGLEYTFLFIDAGPDSVHAAPTLNALLAGPDPQHELRVPIDFTAYTVRTRVAIEYNVTPIATGTRPVEGDIAWIRSGTHTAFGGVATIIIRDLPAGLRIWVRGRVEQPDTTSIPSAWAFPSGDSWFNMTILAPPTSVTGSANGAGIHVIEWVNGETDEPIAVYAKESACASGTLERIRTLPIGSQKFVFAGLKVSTTYCVAVSHTDPFGGESARVTLEFTTGATKSVAPVMADVSVIFGGD